MSNSFVVRLPGGEVTGNGCHYYFTRFASAVEFSSLKFKLTINEMFVSIRLSFVDHYQVLHERDLAFSQNLGGNDDKENQAQPTKKPRKERDVNSSKRGAQKKDTGRKKNGGKKDEPQKSEAPETKMLASSTPKPPKPRCYQDQLSFLDDLLEKTEDISIHEKLDIIIENQKVFFKFMADVMRGGFVAAHTDNTVFIRL